MKIKIIIAILLFCSSAFAAPAVTGFNQSTGVISGSGFGTKTTAAPVTWDNVEDGAVNNTATVGSWTETRSLGISTSNNRHARSSYNATADLGGVTTEAFFTGGSDSPAWNVSYWYFVPSSGFTWGTGNIKMFRHWSTSGSATINWYLLPRPSVSTGHGMLAWDGNDPGLGQSYYSGSCPPTPATGWSPVNDNLCADAAFGHTCNCSDWLQKDIEWRNFDTDMPSGVWHRLEYTFVESDIDTANGKLKIWADGRVIIEKNSLITRTAAQPQYKRPREVGWYNSNTGDADGNVYFDDAYIDNTLARVELCTGSTWAAKGRCEIQPPTDWSASSATVTFNQGAFASEATAYLYVVDSAGDANSSGYAVTIDGTATLTCYPDADNDLYPGSGSESVGTCSSGYYESSHFTAMTADCNDSSATINPGATETCGDSIDQDCSGADLACAATVTLTGSTTGTVR